MHFLNFIVVSSEPSHQNYMRWSERQHQSSVKYMTCRFKNCCCTRRRALLNVQPSLSLPSFLYLSQPRHHFSSTVCLLYLRPVVPSFPFLLLACLSPLLLTSTNTSLFSGASQGHCEITFFTDPLSSVTLPTHQTADPLTLSLRLCLSESPCCPRLSVLLSRYLFGFFFFFFSLTSNRMVIIRSHAQHNTKKAKTQRLSMLIKVLIW